jgi:hypothetical protein
MILTLTTLVWVVMEAWLLIRDAARGKGGTAVAHQAPRPRTVVTTEAGHQR